MVLIFFASHSRKLITAASAFLMFVIAAHGQSTLPDHPTPISRNEIEATIRARDVGDARLTTHYYWFEGAQGDVFINWTSKNFAGDVDLFVQNGLKSLTKMVVYADFGEVETGRVIYLRKPEKLLLRVQGRTPNDEAATYRMKFAGSFVAAAANENDVPAMPIVGETVTGAVRVNSVGTILPPTPKPAETKAEETTKAATVETDAANVEKVEPEKQINEKQANTGEEKETPKLEVVVDDPVKKAEPKKQSVVGRPPRRARTTRNTRAKQTETKAAKDESSAVADDKVATDAAVESPVPPETKSASKGSTEEKQKSTAKTDPLANVQLVIMFKDGSKIERPLPEVFRFSVDRGVLTVVSKDGRVGKYQMVDVARVTIE